MNICVRLVAWDKSNNGTEIKLVQLSNIDVKSTPRPVLSKGTVIKDVHPRNMDENAVVTPR